MGMSASLYSIQFFQCRPPSEGRSGRGPILISSQPVGLLWGPIHPVGPTLLLSSTILFLPTCDANDKTTKSLGCISVFLPLPGLSKHPRSSKQSHPDHRIFSI